MNDAKNSVRIVPPSLALILGLSVTQLVLAVSQPPTPRSHTTACCCR